MMSDAECNERFSRLKNQLRIHWHWLKDTDHVTTHNFVKASWMNKENLEGEMNGRKKV